MISLLRKFAAYANLNFKDAMEYRADAVIYAFFVVFFPLFFLVVWMAVLDSGGKTPFSRDDFIRYYVFAAFINVFVDSWFANGLALDIRTGTVISSLLKPHPFILFRFASKWTWTVMKAAVFLPFGALLILIFFRQLQFQHGVNVLVFLPALFMAAVIYFLIDFSIGMLAFWFHEISSIKDYFALVGDFLSGALMPIALIPWINKDLLYLLPFRYTLSFPIEILMNSLSNAELVRGILLQVTWLVFFILLYIFLRKRSFKRYQSFGG